MATFKHSSKYGVRSISLPTRSHPTTIQVEEELNKLKSWDSSSSSSSCLSSKVETICHGLLGLGKLYKCIEDLLKLPLTQQALGQHKDEKWVNEFLDCPLRFLDLLGKTRDSILLMKSSVEDLQSSLRRRRNKLGNNNLDIEGCISSYWSFRRNIRKDSTKNLLFLKQIDDGSFLHPPLDLDHDDDDSNNHLCALVRVLRESSLITSSIFQSLFVFLSSSILKSKPTKWAFVSRLVHKGVLISCNNNQQENVNVLEKVDLSLSNLELLIMENLNKEEVGEKIQSTNRRLEALVLGIQGIEEGLPSLLKPRLKAERIEFFLEQLSMTTGVKAAAARTKRVVKITLALLGLGFNTSKCKTAAKMAVARIKLLRNKREVVVRQMRRDIAVLLHSGQDATARIRVEHVMREQNILAANEFIELFCELIVSRLSIISKQRDCPADLKEGIASLIFAAPRCSEIPELVSLKNIFEKKYGKDFVSAATDLRPSCGVNRQLIDKLSVRTPPGELKLKVLKEIAKEHQEGPKTFVSASSFPAVIPTTNVSTESNQSTTRLSGGGRGGGDMNFEDSMAAAEAAAESAKKAIAAAEVAAYMAMKDHNNEAPQSFVYNNKLDNSNNMVHQSTTDEKMCRSRSLPRSEQRNSGDYSSPTEMYGGENGYRRHSYHPTPAQHSDIKFDESDCDEEIEMEEPPSTTLPPKRPPPSVPSSFLKQDSSVRVHPKLPDYDELAARFDALKFKKSQP
ncbi:hypothetical protein PIB30_042093 [Stylosanthes scabra]|uniref:IST1-like protein n=1 Tax=Stylosanthes scabra TaxID=79078 RepID=A0ABU6TER0_9FABA|nr:hypothetical protein [Stylosanthes scabra]